MCQVWCTVGVICDVVCVVHVMSVICVKSVVRVAGVVYVTRMVTLLMWWLRHQCTYSADGLHKLIWYIITARELLFKQLNHLSIGGHEVTEFEIVQMRLLS